MDDCTDQTTFVKQIGTVDLELVYILGGSPETHIIFKCKYIFEPRHENSKKVVCATSKPSDQPAHTRSLIRGFASRLNIL